jgi:hypothetical protein
MRAFVIAGLVVALAPHLAFADAARAKKLLEEGRAFAKDKNWAKACASFKQSLELDAKVVTKVELAGCLDQAGYAWPAWQLFVEAAGEADGDLETRAVEGAKAIESKLAIVIIKVADPKAPGLGITLNGRDVKPAAKVRELVDPGTVELVAVASQGRFARTIEAKRGDKVTIEVPQLAEIERRRKTGWVYASIGFGAVGVAGIAGAIGSGLVNQRFDGTVIGIGIGGLVAGGIGAGLYIAAPKESVKHILVVPAASEEGAGLVLLGSF